MSVETTSLFTRVIQEHLALKERNARLEGTMPLTRYKVDDPFDNHPLFKTEEQARLEESTDGEVQAVDPSQAAAVQWPAEEETGEHVGAALDSGLWGRSRDFDWGD
jgi:hypothetical protein